MNSGKNSSEGIKTESKAVRWPMAIVLTVLIIVCGFLLYQCTPGGLVDAGEDTTDKAVETVTKILGSLDRDNITNTFTERLTSISNSKGTLLEVAIIKSIEQFKRSTSNWRGTTISEIRVPAVFKYDVSLKEQWIIETRESENANICIVLAPKLKPSLPVPIVTHQMEKYSDEGWLRWDGEVEMEALLSEITPHLNRRARLKAKLARDKARLAVGEFTKIWLLEADHWREDRFSIIQVIFSDELKDNTDLESVEFRPTITLR